MKGLPPPPSRAGIWARQKLWGLQDRGNDIAIGGTLTSWTLVVPDMRLYYQHVFIPGYWVCRCIGGLGVGSYTGNDMYDVGSQQEVDIMLERSTH